MVNNEEKVVADEIVDELETEHEGKDKKEKKSKKEKKDEKDIKINQLEEQVTALTNEIEKIKKAAADIVNRNKQMEIDKKFASSDLVKKMLVPLSYFEGALKYKSDDEAMNNFLKGFEMIYNLLVDTLKSDGLKEINTKVNDPFDPYIHEVTELIEVEGVDEGQVLEILQSGFTYKDRVIKPTKVKVSKLKEETNVSENNENQDEMVN